MSKSNNLESDLLKLIFNGVTIAKLAENPADALSHLYVSLHTADPGDDGNQSTNECNYTSYSRVAVARTSSGWSVSNTATNVSAVVFPNCTGGVNIATHIGIGTDATGAGKLLYSGSLTMPITITAGVAPNIPAGGITVMED